MADRITRVGPRRGNTRTENNILVTGIAEHGRASRPEMLEKFRSYYRYRAEEAALALSLTDEEIIVETYTGVWARNNVKEVTE